MKEIKITDIENINIGQVEDREIESVLVRSHRILHTRLNAQNPEWLDEQVEQQNPD